MNENSLYAMLRTESCAAFVVSPDQTILFWNKGAERILGYRSEDVVGRRCYDIPNAQGAGFTPECLGGCPSIRYLRAGLVPAQSKMRMSCISGEGSWISVTPMVTSGTGNCNLLVYVLEESPDSPVQVGEDLAQAKASQQPRRTARGPRTPPGANGKGTVLTQRELEVLELVAQGWETPRIAIQLGISQHTVRNHIRNLRHKLNAATKLEAVVTGIKAGMLPVRPP